MGFLSKLFGRKEKEIKFQEKTLSINELNKLIKEKTINEFNSLKNNFISLQKEINEKLTELTNAVKELNEVTITEESDERLKNVVKTAKKKLVKQFNNLIPKLMHTINLNSFNDFKLISSYSINSINTLNSTLSSIQRTIAYSSILLKKEINSIGLIVKQLITLFNELNELINSSNYFKLNKLKKELSDLNNLINEMTLIENNLSSLKEKLNTIEFKKTGLEKKLTELRNSNQLKELSNLNKKIDLLQLKIGSSSRKIIDSLIIFSKPLARLLKLSKAKKFLIPNELLSFLELYSVNSLNALKFSLENFKLILIELKSASSQQTLNLSENERNKLINSIDCFDFNALKVKLNELNSFEIQIKRLKEKIESNPILSEIKTIENNLSNSINSITSTEKEIKTINEKKSVKEKNLNNLINLISIHASKLFKEKITLFLK